MIIGTAGHIDHGKTALVKALTGVDTDRLPEEKKRGITLDLGFAPIELDGAGLASIVDVPGHEAFVKTMIAGAAGIDVALLVIAADEGVMPQTREHLSILEVLGIPKLVVAITKSDLVDDEWLRLVRDEVAEIIASTGKSAAIVSCSSVTGAGIAELRSALAAVASENFSRDGNDLFRLPVDRSFTLKGIGTVLTGSVWSGTLEEDSEVRILPGNLRARARRLQQHGKQVARVGPGQRAAIALAGVEVGDVPRGSILVTDAAWVESAILDVEVTLVGKARSLLRPRTKVSFQLGGAELAATLSFAAGQSPAIARVKLDTPIACRGGDRFVLRLPSPVGTIGGGVVLDPQPGRRSLGASAGAFLSGLGVDPGARFKAILESALSVGLEIASIPVRIGCSPTAVSKMLSAADTVSLGGKAFARVVVNNAKARLMEHLKTAETTFPLADGVQRESARAAIGCCVELFDIAAGELEREGALAVAGAYLRSCDWSPVLSESDAKTVDSLAHVICASGNEPPSASELKREFGGDVVGLLRYLEHEGRVVQVGADRFYARAAVDELVAKLRDRLSPGTEYGPSQLRELLGFSRKYLIPFLEYCDRAGITERKGEGRVLRSTRQSLTQML